MSSYQVFRTIETGLPRDHHALFVETHEVGPNTGHVYNVQGEIQNGMTFEHDTTDVPEKSPMLAGKELIGTVSHADYPRVLSICQNNVPVPEKQFDGPKRLYPKAPLRRCQEWTREAIQALLEEKVVQQ